jgi:hypothetical protein
LGASVLQDAASQLKPISSPPPVNKELFMKERLLNVVFTIVIFRDFRLAFHLSTKKILTDLK